MAKCAQCGADTHLFVNEVPLCVKCDAKREAEWSAALEAAREAQRRKAEPDRADRAKQKHA